MSAPLDSAPVPAQTPATAVGVGDADRFRGATVEDLDPPGALSISPDTPISHALMLAYERDYTHLTVVAPANKALLGYIAMPKLRAALETRAVLESAPVSAAMMRFRRPRASSGAGAGAGAFPYRIITMDTPLELLEVFFQGGLGHAGERQEFAVVTDQARRFVLGVATREDLEKFLQRRPR